MPFHAKKQHDFLNAMRQMAPKTDAATRIHYNSLSKYYAPMKFSDVAKLLVISLLFLHGCEAPASGPAIFQSPQEGTPSPVMSAPSSTSGMQKLTYKIGPFNLPSGQKAQTMWEAPGSINFQVDEPLWIVSFENSIEDGSGGTLPDELLHMTILSNAGEKNPLCTEKEIANPFIAATSITKKIEFPETTGYAILPDDQLGAKVILQNPTPQDFNNVYFKFALAAVPMASAKNIKDVSPLFLNIDPCDYSPINVPPNEFVKKEASFIVPEAGLLTKAYGLMQDYGVEVTLKTAEQPTPFWEAKAELSDEHKIISLPEFEDPAGIPIRAGDTISLGIVYDNSSDKWQNSAIGAVMAYVIRTEEEPRGIAKAAKAVAIDATTAQKTLLK